MKINVAAVAAEWRIISDYMWQRYNAAPVLLDPSSESLPQLRVAVSNVLRVIEAPDGCYEVDWTAYIADTYRRKPLADSWESRSFVFLDESDRLWLKLVRIGVYLRLIDEIVPYVAILYTAQLIKESVQ
jgi:hypothetical protein